jgi:cell division protein FtsL
MMEETEGQNINQQKKGSFLKDLFSGSMVSEKLILNNVGYIAFLAFLAAVYIANRYDAERITRETTRLQNEIKDLRTEALSTSADLMFISRQSKVFSMIRERGLDLEELKDPPYMLIVNKK